MQNNNQLEILATQLRNHHQKGMNKAECVKACAPDNPQLTRAEALSVYNSAFGMNAAQASTYFYSYHTKNTEQHEVLIPQDVECVEPETSTTDLRESIRQATELAANWYLERTVPITRERFLKRGGIRDDGQGAVYSYHDPESTLYIGITGHRVKSRLTTPTSPHSQKQWWPLWDEMRFLSMTNRSERETLEYLLILGLAPEFNQKPSAIDLDIFLDRY